VVPKPAALELKDFPCELHAYIDGAIANDFSSSPGAKAYRLQKGAKAWYLKVAPSGSLESEARMFAYFWAKALSPKLVLYRTKDRDYMLTEALRGQALTSPEYTNDPKRLCRFYAKSLRSLHSAGHSLCPRRDRMADMLGKVREGWPNTVDERILAYGGFVSPHEAYAYLSETAWLLTVDTLIHGDYCLPNVIAEGWKLSGFVDLDYSGVGDFHFDLFWGCWSLVYNLGTDEYRSLFLDSYGREGFDERRFRACAAISALT